MKKRFLLGSSRRDAYRWALRAAAAALLLAALVGCIFVLPGSASENGLLLDFTLNYWLSIPITVGWMTIAILLMNLQRFIPIASGLQAVGRTGFTNYIIQTVIYTTLFYGHGLRLFGSLNRSQLMLVVLIIWVFEVMASIFWLRYFQFGPIEWIQRRGVILEPSGRLKSNTRCSGNWTKTRQRSEHVGHLETPPRRPARAGRLPGRVLGNPARLTNSKRHPCRSTRILPNLRTSGPPATPLIGDMPVILPGSTSRTFWLPVDRRHWTVFKARTRTRFNSPKRCRRSHFEEQLA
jgi:hypothetical protein